MMMEMLSGSQSSYQKYDEYGTTVVLVQWITGEYIGDRDYMRVDRLETIA